MDDAVVADAEVAEGQSDGDGDPQAVEDDTHVVDAGGAAVVGGDDLAGGDGNE